MSKVHSNLTHISLRKVKLEVEIGPSILYGFMIITGLNSIQIFPIRCNEELLADALNGFPGKISSFPGKFLGLPLHIRKLRRVDVQPLIDKIGIRLPGWKGKMLSSARREILVKSVLTSQPIYHLTMFPTQKNG